MQVGGLACAATRQNCKRLDRKVKMDLLGLMNVYMVLILPSAWYKLVGILILQYTRMRSTMHNLLFDAIETVAHSIMLEQMYVSIGNNVLLLSLTSHTTVYSNRLLLNRYLPEPNAKKCQLRSTEGCFSQKTNRLYELLDRWTLCSEFRCNWHG